jgi:hypothetical protein
MNYLNITNESIDTKMVAHALAFILPKAGFSDLLLAVSPEENEIVMAFQTEKAIGDFYAITGLTPRHHIDVLVELIMTVKQISPTQIAVFELLRFPELYLALESIAFPNNNRN